MSLIDFGNNYSDEVNDFDRFDFDEWCMYDTCLDTIEPLKPGP